MFFQRFKWFIWIGAGVLALAYFSVLIVASLPAFFPTLDGPTDLQLEAAKRLLEILGSVFLLVVVGGVTGWATYNWNIQQKRRELDLQTARDFQLLYGEFFAVWKAWNDLVEKHKDDVKSIAKDPRRCLLLDRATEGEGKMEATLVRIACRRNLSPDDIEVLGRFRQIYQVLRGSIEDNKGMDWWRNKGTDEQRLPYLALKILAPKVIALIEDYPRNPPTPRAAGMSLYAITTTYSSNWWLESDGAAFIGRTIAMYQTMLAEQDQP